MTSSTPAVHSQTKSIEEKAFAIFIFLEEMLTRDQFNLDLSLIGYPEEIIIAQMLFLLQSINLVSDVSHKTI